VKVKIWTKSSHPYKKEIFKVVAMYEMRGHEWAGREKNIDENRSLGNVYTYKTREE
jgi:hypothetical protein